MPPAPHVLSLATAVPPYRLDQDDVIRRVEALFNGAPALERLLPVFANSGIRSRYSCVPIEWYDRQHSWAERNGVYITGALDLLETTTVRLLDRAGIGKHQIDAVVTVSTTGIATPSLDALLIERMELRRDVRRLPIFGLGCAGGVDRPCPGGEPSAGTARRDRAASGCRIVRFVVSPRRLDKKQHRRDRALSATAPPARCCRPKARARRWSPAASIPGPALSR